MAQYSNLKAYIEEKIYENGTQAITGDILQDVLKVMTDDLGEFYQTGGVASPSTDPGTPDAKVIYFATEAGTYTNFGGITLAAGEVALLIFETSWTKVELNVLSSANGGVKTANLADGAVTTEKIAGGAVETAKIANNAVTSGKVADGAIGTAKIADGAIGADKIAANAVESAKIKNGAVTEGKINDGAVTADKVAANAVTTAKIADDAVTTAKLNDGAVTEDKIATDAVTSGKVKDGAIGTAKIAAGAVTHAKIGAGAVEESNIKDGAVTSDKIADGAVGSDQLAEGAFSAQNLADGSVTTDKLADEAVTAEKIADGAVTADKFANGSVTTIKLGSGAVTTEKIGDGMVTRQKLADSSVSTSKIIDGAVTTAKVADGNVTTAKIADANVTTGKLADGAVTTAKIADGNVTGAKLQEGVRPVINVNALNEQTSAYGSAALARAAVPSSLRILGLHIIYLLAGGWFEDEYIGSDVSGWGTGSNWRAVGPVTVSQNKLTIGLDKVATLDFVNVNIVNDVPTTPYGGNVGARNAVPTSLRNYGVTIQYLLSDGWHISKFIGDDLEDWEDLTKWSYPFGDTITNYYYETIWLDGADHILFGVMSDGNFVFGKGCPRQIKDLLDMKVDKEQGKALLNSLIANGMSVSVANEIIDVITDKTGKVTEATYDDGTKLIPKLKAYSAYLKDIELSPIGIESLKEQIAERFCNYQGGDFAVFNKCLCIGDSLTAGVFNYYDSGTIMNWVGEPQYSYPTYLKKISGVDVVNMGHGGYTSADWYNEYKDTDLSGYDIALIQLGVNDAGQYGGWTQTSIDAFINIINKLKTDNAKIKIFVSTITPVTAYTGTSIDAVSQGIRDLVKTLNDKDVILVDMAKYGHTAESDAYNCQHLSAYGYWRLAKDWYNIVSYLISTNKMNYREVQFIGTDYQYEH